MKKILAMLVVLASLSGVANARDLPDFTGLAEKLGPSVVNISSVQVLHDGLAIPKTPRLSEDDPMYEFFRRFMNPHLVPKNSPLYSLGSGFFLTTDGYVLTNAHVVDDADEVMVRLIDRREFRGRVVGSDRHTDVALIKIEASDLPSVVLGKPDQLRLGEWVVAIGSLFGLDTSITAGIVSAKGHVLPQEDHLPLIQTDAAVNAGNSGGPLINMKGEVVGINSQTFSRTDGYMGLSFAIPIDVAVGISDQLRSQGCVYRGWLGVSIQEVSKELADSFGLAKPAGALIAHVEKGSPADKAGLMASDVILKFDGKSVEDSNDLPSLAASVRPGRRVIVQLWRKGAIKDVYVVVAEGTDKNPSCRGRTVKATNKLGMALSELTVEQKKALKLGNGILVESADGPAARAGVTHGDIILAVNSTEVVTVKKFNDLLSRYGGGRSIAILLRRGDRSMYVAIHINGK